MTGCPQGSEPAEGGGFESNVHFRQRRILPESFSAARESKFAKGEIQVRALPTNVFRNDVTEHP